MSRSTAVSIVVPCYNRASYLDRLLSSFTWSSVPLDTFEVLVVNDGGGDREHLASVVASARRKGMDIQVIELREPGPPRNNAAARNAGLRAARHEVVLQTDPDIMYATDVLALVPAALTPGTFCSCSGYYPLTEVATRHVMARHASGTLTASELIVAATGRPNQVSSPDGVGGLHGAFAAYRDDLLAIGGYDESFSEWGWEDRELLVTLAIDRGLARRRIKGAVVVHLWHPMERGDVHREALAASGHVSDAAWRVQLQAAAAEHPRSRRSGARLNLRESAPVDGVFRTTRYLDLVSDRDRRLSRQAAGLAEGGRLDEARRWLPPVFEQILCAQAREVSSLRSAGFARLARRLALVTLRCPWEHEDPRLVEDDGAPPSPYPIVGPIVQLYPSSPALLYELAVTEADLGNDAGWESALEVLCGLPGGRRLAALARTRRALLQGDVEQGCAEAVPLEEWGGDVDVVPVLIETAVLRGRPGDAAKRLAAVDLSAVDTFAAIRLNGYARLLGRRPANEDDTEFLFSVAVRSMRVGLDLAAFVLLERFLNVRPPAEPRLFAEARRLIEETGRRPAWARWSTGTPSARGS